MFFKSEGEGHNNMKYPVVIEVPWKVVIDSEKNCYIRNKNEENPQFNGRCGAGSNKKQ